MNFDLSEEHIAVKEAARDFAQNVLKPGVIQRDNDQQFPADEIKQLAELGFMGMMVDPKYGGSGMDTLSYVLAMEEISKIDASTSVCMSVNNSLVCWGLEKYGSEEQKQKYLVPLATGEKIGAFCLSEPEAGSDATSQSTTAIDKGDYYLLNGTKNWSQKCFVGDPPKSANLCTSLMRVSREICATRSPQAGDFFFSLGLTPLCPLPGSAKGRAQFPTLPQKRSLDTGVRLEGIPSLSLWEQVVEIMAPNFRSAGGNTLRTNNNFKKID